MDCSDRSPPPRAKGETGSDVPRSRDDFSAAHPAHLKVFDVDRGSADAGFGGARGKDGKAGRDGLQRTVLAPAPRPGSLGAAGRAGTAVTWRALGPSVPGATGPRNGVRALPRGRWIHHAPLFKVLQSNFCDSSPGVS